jgi:hypothetical protein
MSYPQKLPPSLKFSSAKSPDFVVSSKQFPNCLFSYPVGGRMHITSRSGDFEEQRIERIENLLLTKEIA